MVYFRLMNKIAQRKNISIINKNKSFGVTVLTLITLIVFNSIYAQLSLTRKIDSYPHQTATVGGESFTLLVTKSESERAIGLSAIDKLPKNYGMLFKVYPGSGIWMKDMKYPIDIIWVDSENQISYLVDSAQPSSYPEIIYKNPSQSSANDAYIIEINSGEIKRLQLKLGDEIILN